MILDVETVCGAIDNNFAELIHTIITIIKFAIPILLIIFGMIDFAKGVAAGKEDEIKKGQNIFIKRLISAILVFFAVSIVQLIIGLANSDEEDNIWSCANLIINGKTNNNEVTGKQKRNQKVKNCCNEVNGEIMESSDGETYSCRIPDDEKTKKYNECFNKE